MRVVGAVTDGSGAVNEDACGFAGDAGDVQAAWVFDGVTGINSRQYLPGGNDAAWLVSAAQDYLIAHVAEDVTLEEMASRLVDWLIAAWNEVSSGLALPADYDPPAACLILVKRFGDAWSGLRLGDSCLLAREAGGEHRVFAASPNNSFDHWLAMEAKRRRDQGVLDIKALLAEFRPQLLAARKRRNQPDGYSVLEADARALDLAEHIDLDSPESLLLCTDGFYRAADHYGLYDDNGLLDACLAEGGCARVLKEVRETEAADPLCLRYLRFKPADDATAVVLGR
ncbi:MAG: protein phosphatase 2C domain-containing protein [Rhizobiales bacterium]|nr:protein phosphatase 2C domain-containing protein [Hyphomicrobiales bacterium]